MLTGDRQFRPNLQELFDRPILEQDELDPGVEDHGSLVVRVRTSREHVIVRAFRRDAVEGPFWGNLQTLFGVNPLVASEVVPIHSLLAAISPIPVPRVLRVGTAEDREWLVVQLMQGSPLKDFNDLSDDGLIEFGRNLGSIHMRRFDMLGNPSGSVRFPLSEFHRRLAETFRHSADSYPEGKRLSGMVDDMCAAATELPPPIEGALVMPDIFSGQFLQRERRIVAMIDVDAYVVGPRELDFICLEFFIDGRAGALISQGYSEICPLPRLDQVRPVYRYFFRLLTMIPTDLDVEEWMTWPESFQ